MQYVIPTVGARGFYTLQAPFNTLIAQDDAYTCQAVRRIGDYLALNEDPLNNVYIYNGLTEADFELDQKENMFIVSLQSDRGQWLYVPVRYIISYPIMNGIPYQTMMLGVSLGAVPADMDLTSIQNMVSDLVFETIGIRPQISPVVTSKQKLVSRANHEAIEIARLARATQNKTFYSRWRDLVTQFTSLLQKNTELETYIKNNLPP